MDTETLTPEEARPTQAEIDARDRAAAMADEERTEAHVLRPRRVNPHD